jgi:ribulose 1,5-bisphosphate synthetase/thiazole synthase
MSCTRLALVPLLLVLGLAAPATAQKQEKPRKVDVVVYGATPAGIIAAVTVAREGKSVLLL